MNYISGAHGFLASHLLKRIDATPIPHNKLSSIKLKPFETFYFCSAYGNVFDQQEEDKIIQANLLDLIKVLDQAVKFKFKSFVYISTSSVKLRTQSMYSRSKRAAEEILLAYMEKYDVPICIIRPYTIIGVGDNPKHLVPTLFRSCLKGEHITFTPNPTHDYIDIEDVVEGILNLSGHRAKGIFELGTGEQYSNDVVKIFIEKICSKKANANIVDSLRPYDNANWVSTNFRARSFGWFPKKTLAVSIQEIYAAQTTDKT